MAGLMEILDYLATSADKPGRSLRGALAGRPDEMLAGIPFSDSLGITDPTRSVSGGDLLSQYGMVTGDEMIDAGLGLGAEMLLDPLNLLGGVGIAKGAKYLKGANQVDPNALDHAIHSLLPKPELRYVPPVPMQERLGQISVDDLPIRSAVEGLPPHLIEPQIFANREARTGLSRKLAEMGEPEMEFDPAMLDRFTDEDWTSGLGLPPSVDDVFVPPGPPPPYEDFAWMLGRAPTERGFYGTATAGRGTSIASDAAQTPGVTPEQLQLIGINVWDEALGRISASADPLFGIRDKQWRSALVERLGELTIARTALPLMAIDRAGRFGLAKAIDTQADAVKRLLGPSKHIDRVTFGVPPLENLRSLAFDEAKKLQPMPASPLVQPSFGIQDLASAERSLPESPEAIENWNLTQADNPLLQIDPKAAMAYLGRKQAERTARDLIRESRHARYDSPSDYDLSALEELLSGFTPTEIERARPPKSALAPLKGALRTSPEARSAYRQLLEILASRGVEFTPPVPIPGV